MKQICGDCLHYYACAAWNIGSLANTEAGSCVNYTPAADVEEVVRCKDCELWGSITDEEGRRITDEEGRQRCIEFNTDWYCDLWESDGLMPNDYCSKGQRKEDE